ncbi:putative lipid II flippase FtsW [Armatimonas sp.]|uniref:putative lipid II flippase FtsW n=1 Tax=Armatimonas sp. TaxID=1872638 RepID=UPI00375357F1
MNENQRRLAPDWWLFVIILLLLMFGIVMVYDSSYCIALAYDDYNNDPFYFARKQLTYGLMGLGGLLICSRIPYWWWKRLAVPGLLISIALLLIVWRSGHSSLGARRWIGFGPIVIQPSELAKLAVVLFLSWVLTQKRALIQTGRGVFWLSVAVGIPIVLTERQPDLGTAATIFVIYLIMLTAAGVQRKHLAILLGVSALLAVGTLYLPSKSHPDEPNYRMRRMLTFIHPEADKEKDGYQVWRGLVALGSGGTSGVGLGNSHEKRPGGLPAQRTDFIFAVVGEEFGLLGTSLVLLGFFGLACRGLSIALRTKDPFGRFLATGLTVMVSGQALINMAVVTACAPTTGIPLPLISYGGSSLIPTLCGLGILLGISCRPFFQENQGKKSPLKERHSERFFRKAGIK